MNPEVLPTPTQDQPRPFVEGTKAYKKVELNFKRNQKTDQTENIELATRDFDYEICRDQFWNPQEYSLLYGTPLWEGASEHQRVLLNQLYWVAYYSQIISAEIATIYFNQTSAAGLFGLEDFKLVCDTLDLESAQERTHIAAFKRISEDVEEQLFGERVFSYPMRLPFETTMIFSPQTSIQKFWRKIQLNSYGLLSANYAFIACQYFTVRGLRTLNGKLTQHQLSQYYIKNPVRDSLAIPSKVSFYHFLDESFHFNSSTLISHDILKCLPQPTKFESFVANLAIKGCQRDHFHFSTAINGIFWYDPALFPAIYKILRSNLFNMSPNEAKEMMWKCFGEENEAMHINARVHNVAKDSYVEYLDRLDYVWKANKDMSIMSQNNLSRHIKTNQIELEKYFRRLARANN